jgi:hypothetical protein
MHQCSDTLFLKGTESGLFFFAGSNFPFESGTIDWPKKYVREMLDEGKAIHNNFNVLCNEVIKATYVLR